jgi:hypothetical protein
MEWQALGKTLQQAASEALGKRKEKIQNASNFMERGY